jgi:hypothetical protein
MVNHLKRGKALRLTLALTDLVYAVSQSSQKADTSAASWALCPLAMGAEVAEVNLFYPLSKDWGAAESGWGKEMNTPPVSFCLSLPGRTREAS